MQKDKVRAFYEQLERSQFIDKEFKNIAQLDRPLPIGYEQTISQPTLVLQMTLQLNLEKGCRVLEVGTGSGYQTAMLAEFAEEVFTIERIEELSKKAQKRLSRLGYSNIRFRVGDGSDGWQECAPYDRIIITAAAGIMPDMLLEQLKPGGIAIAPVGAKTYQELLKIKKDEDGNLTSVSLGGVRFVEMKGKYGWKKNNIVKV